jgi:hypothetical protein
METGPNTRLKKDPQAANWPKGIDWTRYLALLGADEVIAASTWSRTGDDTALILSSASIVTGARKTQVRMAGGTVGVSYLVTNHITTSSGVEDDRSFTIVVGER